MARTRGSTNLSFDEKMQIVRLMSQGLSISEVGRQTRRSRRVIRKFWQRWQNGDNTLQTGKSTGRPLVTTQRDDNHIATVSLRNPFLTAPEVKENSGVAASVSTVKRRLRHRGLLGCIAARKERLTAGHRLGRFRFCRVSSRSSVLFVIFILLTAIKLVGIFRNTQKIPICLSLFYSNTFK